jgi:RNA-directed DNA polymerase
VMHGDEKSDPSVVAAKPMIEGGASPEELVERRGGAEGNAIEHGMRRTPSRVSMSPGLDRVREADRERKQERFTALLHHVDVDLLRSAYGWLRQEAAAAGYRDTMLIMHLEQFAFGKMGEGGPIGRPILAGAGRIRHRL